MSKLLIKIISIYKKVFPAIRAIRLPLFIYTDCKFYPSCSDYAIESIKEYGVVKGSAKSVARILRCSPFSKGGIDMP